MYVFEQKYEKYQIFLSENFPFLVVKFSVYSSRHVFVMKSSFQGKAGLPNFVLIQRPG